jgi:hypothetical protein
MNVGRQETGKDHRRAASERRHQHPSSPMICHGSPTFVLVPTAVGCCPSAARRGASARRLPRHPLGLAAVDEVRRPCATADPAPARPQARSALLRYLGLSGLADGDERCDVARGRLPVGMWQRANHRPDDRRCLIDTIRPCRHEVADKVIDPTFAVDISAALKPSVIGIAVGVVARAPDSSRDRRASRIPARTSARSRRGSPRRNARHRRGRQGQGYCGSFGSSRSRQTD